MTPGTTWPTRSRLLPALAAALLLTACGGDAAARTGGTVQATGPADDQSATVVSVEGLRYDPGVVQAEVGTLTLTHRNDSPVPHNLVFADEELGAIDTVTEGESRSLTLTFGVPGEYDFVCTFHPGQEGQVVVGRP